MVRLYKLKEILNSEEFKTYHSMDYRQRGFCEEDLNALFELMGEDEKIIEFIESDHTTSENGALIADKIAKTGYPWKTNIEFESSKPSKKALNKQAKYMIVEKAKHEGFIKGICITTSKTKKRIEFVNLGPSGVIIIYVMPYYCIDGDEQLEIIKNKIKYNIPINRKDVIFMTMCLKTKYKIKDHEMLLKVAHLTNEINVNKELLTEIKLDNAIDCVKLINEQYQDEILEVLDMDFVLTEKVVEKSKEIGIEEVAKKMIKNNEPINKIIKYTNIPKEKIKQLTQEINNETI